MGAYPRPGQDNELMREQITETTSLHHNAERGWLAAQAERDAARAETERLTAAIHDAIDAFDAGLYATCIEGLLAAVNGQDSDA